MTAEYRQMTPRSGVALLTALGLLFVFSMLGVAYIGYSTSALDRAGYDARIVRARHAALAGVNSAIGQIRAKVLAGKGAETAGTSFTLDMPVYMRGKGEDAVLVRRDNLKTSVRVSISDESGKVNLNHVPAPILADLLGVDDVGTLSKALANTDSLGPFVSINEIQTRGLAKADAPISRDSLSTDNATSGEGYLNLNATPVSTLAAILGVAPDVAAKVAAARPFADFAAVAAVSGRQPTEWAWKPAPGTAPGVPAAALTLTSKAFRVICEGSCFKTNVAGAPYEQVHRTIEAVMAFSESGGDPVILHWKETSGASAQ